MRRKNRSGCRPKPLASKNERDQARLADQKAQDDEMARIHAAEQKANANLDAAAGDSKPDQATVPWQDSDCPSTL